MEQSESYWNSSQESIKSMREKRDLSTGSSGLKKSLSASTLKRSISSSSLGRTLKRAASKLSLSSREKSGSTLSVSAAKGPFGRSVDQDAQSIKSDRSKSSLSLG